MRAWRGMGRGYHRRRQRETYIFMDVPFLYYHEIKGSLPQKRPGPVLKTYLTLICCFRSQGQAEEGRTAVDSPFKSGLFVSGYGRGPLALTLIGGVLLVCIVTAPGWAQLPPQSVGGTTGRAFVAMSFDAALDGAYVDGIHPALVACGCEPIRIDPAIPE